MSSLYTLKSHVDNSFKWYSYLGDIKDINVYTSIKEGPQVVGVEDHIMLFIFGKLVNFGNLAVGPR